MPPPHLVPPAPNFFPISVLLEVRENGSVEKICWMQGRGKHLLEVRRGIIPGCKNREFLGCKNRQKFLYWKGNTSQIQEFETLHLNVRANTLPGCKKRKQILDARTEHFLNLRTGTFPKSKNGRYLLDMRIGNISWMQEWETLPGYVNIKCIPGCKYCII